jgi:transketolase
VYGFLGDGDLMEGISSEAASFAGHNGLGNLIFFYDDNEITIDGPTSLAFSDDVAKRFESQGWNVESTDGEDLDGLRRALASAQAERERPSLIVTRTVIGKGAPNFEGINKAHGGPYGEEENALAKERAGWPVDSSFLVPDEVRAYLAERIDAKKKERLEVDARLEAWRDANAECAKAWDAARERRMPADLAELLAEDMAGVAKASRKHSGTVLERLWDHVPFLVGGSADLAGSGAPPLVKKVGVVGRGAGEGEDPFAGGNLYFGVREHGMAAITNGIALDGTFIPYCGTFLIFSDYMRPSIRLAALMKTRSIFVFTHDSIFVGEDGPTHQPVEQLDSLRAVPGLRVFRPADGVETAMAYAWILENADGPAMLSLTRQDVDAVDRCEPFELRDVWRGGYAVRQPASGKPDVVIAATGSEVSLACKAADELASSGIDARVVSVPCIELFLEQPEDYQYSLIPDDGTPLVAVEASRAESFRQLVGRRGLVYGVKTFGASAPWKDLAKHFGFVPDKLAAAVRAHLAEG